MAGLIIMAGGLRVARLFIIGNVSFSLHGVHRARGDKKGYPVERLAGTRSNTSRLRRRSTPHKRRHLTVFRSQGVQRAQLCSLAP